MAWIVEETEQFKKERDELVDVRRRDEIIAAAFKVLSRAPTEGVETGYPGVWLLMLEEIGRYKVGVYYSFNDTHVMLERVRAFKPDPLIM